MARKKQKANVLVQSFAVQAPVERVWKALTSGRDLGLLVLGRVEMAAKPGADFRWHWGVWEKVAPGGGKGKFAWAGTVLDVVPGSTLVLGPRADAKKPSPVVTLTVKGEGGAALVTVVQGPTPGSESLEDYEHGWADFLLKLKTYLETEAQEREVLARVLVEATPQQVYRTWLTDRAMAKIFPGKVSVKGKVRQGFSWQHKRAVHVHAGTFLELEKNRRIVFTWKSSHPVSEVVLEAQPTPYGTLVSVHHTGLLRMNRGQLFSQRMFWLRLLERLRCYFYFGGKIKTAE